MRHFVNVARLILFVVMVSLAGFAHAHKVVISAYAEGSDIEGEIGFSNGDMAASIVVEVLDDDGKQVGMTKTDEDGIFLYRPTSRIPLTFRANLGQGHVAIYRMAEDELPEVIAAAKQEVPATKDVQVVKAEIASFPANGDGVRIDQDALQQAIQASLKLEMAKIKSELASAVRRETKPLRKEIAAYKEKNDLQSILGGIGYIIGLFGIAFYVMARRERQRSQMPKEGNV